ncbi:MAG TPA: aldo/keto reductase [Pyrinomonadaceae bacterium]|nr:aldo/keto reductase [Pyrinomonadaceae bacterium]
MIAGYATTEGTTRYRDRFAGAAPNHFRNQQRLLLSSIGIGTYLGQPNTTTDQNYEEAIVRAAQSGVNIIDSAANYRFQRSERNIGAALKTLVNDLGFSRDEFVICTKGGYLPFDGAPPRDVRGYVEETFVKPGVANFDDIVGGSHCMTPAYLQNQLDQSRANLSVECIDLYYVHNPESQLGHISEAEFYHRLRMAFEALESNRKRGALRMYGVATWNGFRVPADSSDYHSLNRMAEIAREVAGEQHGFRFIQLPYNLAMPEALTLRNHTNKKDHVSVLEAAASLGITAVASASLLQGRVARGLPDAVRSALGSLPSDAQTAIQFVRSTPGITTALVGMSNVDHVAQNLELVQIDPVSKEQFYNLMGHNH